MVRARKTKGRQKIDMVKIANDSSLQVTFSKRRNGLFKKANELCTLTGSEVALMVYSPGGKVYSFGSPSVDAIIHRYETLVSQNHPNPNQAVRKSLALSLILERNQRDCVLSLNNEFESLENLVKKEKEKFVSLAQNQKLFQWWEVPIEELQFQELEKLKLSMENIFRNVQRESQKSPISAPVPIFIPSAPSPRAFYAYDQFRSSLTVTFGSGYASTANVLFDPKAIGFDRVQMQMPPPYPYQFFNQGGRGTGSSKN